MKGLRFEMLLMKGLSTAFIVRIAYVIVIIILFLTAIAPSSLTWIYMSTIWIALLATMVLHSVIWIGSIRPFLKEHDEPTARLWNIAIILTDYATASNLAERIGNRPKYLDNFVLILKIQLGLFIVGIISCIVL